MTRIARILAIASAISLSGTAASPARCDEYYSEHGFSIDLPEGFVYLDGDGATKFSFGLPDGSVEVDIAVYPSSRFAGAKSGADDTTRKLSGRGVFSSFQYGGHDAAIGELSIGAGTAALRGYGLFVDDASSPEGGDTYDLVVLAYAGASSYESYRDVVASALDGFSINYLRKAAAGPLGTAARAALGRPRPSEATVRFGSSTIRTEWDPREAAACQSLVEREYRVLSAYASSPELIDAAIARFYRMIFRDATPSLDRLALEMSAAWETSRRGKGARGGEGTAKDGNPRFGAPADPRAYAEALLSWVQGFRYERDPAGSDVVNPISAAFEGRGDCDSRALVMAILLRRENIASLLMVSLEHEHALAAVDAPGAGARFPYEGKGWLVAETTAKVGIGLIDAAQADPAGWIAVRFPD
jgi:hypothetical protein